MDARPTGYGWEESQQGVPEILDGRLGGRSLPGSRHVGVLFALVAILIHPAGAALAADVPPFEMFPEQRDTEPGDSVHFFLSFPSDVDPGDLTGLLEARRVGADADPVLPDTVWEAEEGLFIVEITFPTHGTWELVTFPDVADRAALVDAGYPDRVTVDVDRPAAGWVTPIVIAGLALIVTALAVAGGAWRHRPVVAPWDRTGKPGNRFNREPR